MVSLVQRDRRRQHSRCSWGDVISCRVNPFLMIVRSPIIWSMIGDRLPKNYRDRIIFFSPQKSISINFFFLPFTCHFSVHITNQKKQTKQSTDSWFFLFPSPALLKSVKSVKSNRIESNRIESHSQQWHQREGQRRLEEDSGVTIELAVWLPVPRYNSASSYHSRTGKLRG